MMRFMFLLLFFLLCFSVNRVFSATEDIYFCVRSDNDSYLSKYMLFTVSSEDIYDHYSTGLGPLLMRGRAYFIDSKGHVKDYNVDYTSSIEEDDNGNIILSNDVMNIYKGNRDDVINDNNYTDYFVNNTRKYLDFKFYISTKNSTDESYGFYLYGYDLLKHIYIYDEKNRSECLSKFPEKYLRKINFNS
ncbi:hypothetical protein [Photorhabdus asymbiotica]|uniref:hypothetical protein n=1 Tax=Photorhabdus asymbiotica TaxID=291112 RepID=UPI003DA76840